MLKKSVFLLLALAIFGCADSLNEDIDVQTPQSEDPPCFIGPGGLDCDIIDPPPPTPPPTPDPIFQYFHRGESSSGMSWAKSINTGLSWTVGTVNNGAGTSAGPAAVFHQNTLHVFYKGNSDDRIFRSNSFNNGSTWGGNLVVNSTSRTLQEVSAISFGGKIFLGYDGRYNDNATFVTSTDGYTWSGEIQLPRTTSGRVTEAPAFVEFEGDLYAAYVDTDNRLWLHKYNSSTNTWNTRFELNHPNLTSYTADGISAVEFNGHIYFAYRSTNQNFVETWGWDPNGVPTQFTTPRYLNLAKTSTRPSITTDGNTLMVIFKNNPNNQIWQAKSTNAWNWTTNQVSGKTTQAPYVIYYED